MHGTFIKLGNKHISLLRQFFKSKYRKHYTIYWSSIKNSKALH